MRPLPLKGTGVFFKPMVANSNSLKAEFIAARAKAAQMRREAFLDRPVMVLGFRLRPITLKTHNALIAEGNFFVCPGHRLGVADIQHFIWLHYPQFDAYDFRLQRRIHAKVARRIRGPFQALRDRLIRNPLTPRWLRPALGFTELQKMTAAASEIARQVREAMQDYPSGDGEEREPLPCAHAAYILNTMRRSLNVPFQETESMPMKRIAQHLRELVHDNSHGKVLQMTPEEASILAEDLRLKTEASSTPEAMQAAQDEIKAIAARRMKELGFE